MPTDIYFAGDNLPVKVDEDPSQVADAFASAQGLPIRLTQGARRELYVNPNLVAFWSASEPSPQPEAGTESQQSSSRRQTVTDIWGTPLRRKPRG